MIRELESHTRPSGPLPPIGPTESNSREEAEIQAAQTMVNINPHAAQSTSAPYASAAYHYANSTLSSGATSATATKTSADSHRSSQSEYEPQPNPAPAKQSLPSISEALAQRSNDEHIRPAPRSPGPSYDYSRRYSSPSPTRFNRSYASEHKYEQPPVQRQPSHYDVGVRPHPTSPRSYGPVAPAPRPASPRESFAVPTSRALTSYPPPGPTWSPPRNMSQYGPPGQSPSFAASPYIYSERNPGPSLGPPQPSEFVTSYPAVSTSVYGGSREPPWRPDEPKSLPASKLEQNEPQFPNTVKRNLDYYDLDQLLNEVYDCSHNLMQFSEVYRLRSHQSQRSGPIAGSTPSISDVHHALKFNRKIQEALDFALQKVRADEAERLERETREAAERRQLQVDRVEEVSRTRKETGEGGFAGPDPKKRRGVCDDPSSFQPPPENCEKCIWLMDQCSKRAAPPGRCHACNRAETPEWRRGPDGARTLCNACGLHYAKHTRKMGAQKAAGIQAGSNLRPKSPGPI